MMTPFRYCAENGSTNTLEVALLDDQVVFRGLVFDQEPVLEAAASAGLDADAQAADSAGSTPSVLHELLDLGRRRPG